MLSLIPPSTETNVRNPSSGLTVPTSYTVTVPGPTMPRPGSIASSGTASPYDAHSRSTIPRRERPISTTSIGSSVLV
jgi:hypothetical protein